MKKLIGHLKLAQNAAVARDAGFTISVFIRAMTFDADDNGTPKTASITTHFHYWTHFCSDEEIEAMKHNSVEDLAPIITGWVQTAFDLRILVVTDPPLSGKWKSTDSIEFHRLTRLQELGWQFQGQ